MKETRLMMGMPIMVEVAESSVTRDDLADVFAYFDYIDKKFSTYKENSEISRINRGEITESDYSEDMRTVLKLSAETKQETNGYFDIRHNHRLDPSGLVKGWAIRNAAGILKDKGFKNYYVDAGGDIEIAGLNIEGEPWRVGIRNPFDRRENVKVLNLSNIGIATSGTAIRGQHIYDPTGKNKTLSEIVSITVIGPDVYEADRFATAAFVMQRAGVAFIEVLPGFEGYQIDRKGIATYTSKFNNYVIDPK
jgi:FAD:protein FMN transferase